MLTRKKLKKLQYCRTCLNNQYRLNLRRKDVLIYYLPKRCACCGETKNIIYQIRFPKKLLCFSFRRKKEEAST